MILGPGIAPGPVLILFEQPAQSRFEDDEIHEVQAISAAPEHLDLRVD